MGGFGQESRQHENDDCYGNFAEKRSRELRPAAAVQEIPVPAPAMPMATTPASLAVSKPPYVWSSRGHAAREVKHIAHMPVNTSNATAPPASGANARSNPSVVAE